MNRRTFLGLLAAAGTTAGCTTTASPQSPTPTPTPTEEPPANPWNRLPITVGFSIGKQARERPYTRPAIQEAIAYWNDNPDYAAYEARLEWTPLLDDVDVEVQLRDAIDRCDHVDDPNIVGCAPIVDPSASLEHRRVPLAVKIEHELGHCTTREVVKHELGHVLGLRHYDEPRDVMRATMESGTNAC